MNYLNLLNSQNQHTSSPINLSSTNQSSQDNNNDPNNIDNNIRRRFESLSPMELLILVNQMQSISASRRRRRNLSSELSSDEDCNPHPSSSSEECIDFRTYPIPIDWEKIENDKGDYFAIFEKFGYFGVGIYSSLYKKSKIKLDTDDYIASFLKQYHIVYSDKTKLTDLIFFINSLPSLSNIKALISSGAILHKEKLLIKIVLDMYEKYYMKYDRPCFEKLNNEYLILAEEFYSGCSDSDIKELWNSLINTPSNIKDKVSKISNIKAFIPFTIEIMKFKLATTKEGYVKHFNRIKKKCIMLTKGTTLTDFIQ